MKYIFFIIIRNSYIAPNPTRLAQSTLQFKARLDIRINTWNMHTPDDPTPTANHRQTRTHPGTISATQTCSTAIHGPWKHLMIANQIQRATQTGFYWKVWENKWVFNCDLNEEYVCGVWRKADYSSLRDPDRRKISGLSISFWTEGSSVYVCLR